MITYSDLILLPTFEERLDFLKTNQLPSELTFDQLRFLNQKFYNSKAWKTVRLEVISRDFGCDLAIPGRDILSKIIVHHMNPLAPKDLYWNAEQSMDPELLITVSEFTHKAIHFGTEVLEPTKDRYFGDTILW